MTVTFTLADYTPADGDTTTDVVTVTLHQVGVVDNGVSLNDSSSVTTEGCATFAAVHQVTTAAQREHAAGKLRAWQRSLRELTAQQP